MLNPMIKTAINKAVEKRFAIEKRVTVSFGRVINTGNYSSLRLDTNVSENLPEGVDADETYKRLWNEAFAQVERAEKAFMAKQQAQIKARNKSQKVLM